MSAGDGGSRDSDIDATATRAGTSARSADGASTRLVTHIVHLGDTLYHIAQLYHVSVAQLASWNRLSHTRLLPGQKLIIRVALH